MVCTAILSIDDSAQQGIDGDFTDSLASLENKCAGLLAEDYDVHCCSRSKGFGCNFCVVFQENIMSHKEQKSSRESKKAPAMSLKEKREAKHAKKAAKTAQALASV